VIRFLTSWLGFAWIWRKLKPYRWVLILVLVLLCLALFKPAFDLLLKLVDLVMRVIQPLLETTVGRIVLILLFCVLTAVVAAALLRGRIRELRAGLVLGRHLQGVAALIGDDVKLCRDRLQRVARYKGPRPDAYPALVQDANLKLARLALRHGRPEQVLLHLARVAEQGLPRELERSLRQLRVRALRLQGSVPAETLVAELEEALARFKDDYALCCELRTIRREQGDLAEATALQQRAVDLAPPARRLEEQQRLRLDLEALGQEALRRGDLDTARRAAKDLRKADREGSSWGLLQGKVLAAEGDLRGAVRTWGGTRSPEGLDLIAELLREHPDVLEPRELLECCPMQGTLLVVARMLASRGEADQAERAARLAAETLGPTDSVVGALTEVLQLLGREQQARMLCEQAVRRLVARDEGPG
jgi:tetratricopeptide (TPR) repeat protein